MTTTFISHCETVYRALEERATIQLLKDGEGVEKQYLTFIGAVTPVFQSLSISQSYYGPIFQTLEDVGAILKMQQGTRGVDSIIVLRGLPEVWPEGLGWKGSRSNPLTSDSRYARLLVEVQEIAEGNIGGINVPLALMELEQRIAALEGKVSRTSTVKKGAE